MSHGIVARYEHRRGHGNERKPLRRESEGRQCATMSPGACSSALRWYIQRTESPLHSGLVGRSPATLEKRVPINPDSADRRHPHEHFATRLRDRPRRAPRLRPLPAGTGADLRARTPNQALYLDNIAAQDITFGIGPAGTGKTYLAVAMAVDALQRNAVQRIVLTRPAVEAGERLGFLPGDLSQKVDPYLRPLYDALYELMGVEQVHKAFERSALEVAPLAFMRGRTLNNAFVILDEAQNTTPEQMKMFLTRIGFGSKAVVTGDVSQVDLPKTQLSGLIDAERVLRRVQGIAICRFTSADVVRHPLVARIVDAYDAPNRPASKKSA